MIRALFCFLLISSFAYAQKPMQVDVLIYGANPAGILAAYAAKAAGKKVVLVDPSAKIGHSSAGLGQGLVLNQAEVIGLTRNYFRRAGKLQGQFESFTFDSTIAQGVHGTYVEKLAMSLSSSLTEVQQQDQKISLIRVQSPDGMKVFKAKQVIDCSYGGDLFRLAASALTNLQAPTLTSTHEGKMNDVHYMLAAQAAAIRAVLALQKDVAIADIRPEDIQRYLTYNPNMDGSLPDIVVDDAELASLEVVGYWKKIVGKTGAYGPSFLQTNPQDELHSRIRFHVKSLMKGTYQLYFFLPEVAGLAKNANLDIYVGKVKNTVSFDLGKEKGGTWIPIGTYTFDGTTSDVIIANKGAQGLIVADAIRWVPKN